MKLEKTENMAWIIFALVGTAFFIASIIMLIMPYTIKNKVETTGVISNIRRNQSAHSDDMPIVTVTYTVDGEEKETILNYYSTRFYEGKQLTIYYDKNNPNKIHAKESSILAYGFLGFGVLLSVIGYSQLIRKARKKRLVENLKQTGDLISAEYIATKMNVYYSVNGKHPYNVVCRWIDPGNTKEYQFTSKNLWPNPEDIIAEKNITEFPVYIDKNNKDIYFVDTSIIKEKND